MMSIKDSYSGGQPGQLGGSVLVRGTAAESAVSVEVGYLKDTVCEKSVFLRVNTASQQLQKATITAKVNQDPCLHH
ncbi:hypothetical protein E2C01_033002 [Portunus trituberculatus]|uniref:Uncharacterized protein n=1 Tax=Portunus trituberculatus TaxID=210409 RepID=A0A5B7F4G7_PORTR|nr:hypothetical protein [Portunus trituberculatus]